MSLPSSVNGFRSLPYLLVLTAAASVGSAGGAAVFVDFSDGNTTAATEPEVYNVIGNVAGVTTVTNPLATAGGTLGLTNLDDTGGNATGIDVTISTYNNGSGQLRSNAASSGSLIHDPVAGINVNASGDSFWLNNHNSNGTGAGNEFGFVLTFENLTDPFYNITILAGSNNRPGSWAVDVGIGDSDIENFATAQEDVLVWTNVAPVGGVIELSGTTVPINSNFQNTSISFASIEGVPEPSSAILLGFGGLAMLLRRRR